MSPLIADVGPLSSKLIPMAAAGGITLEEAAQRLGVHYMTAYRYVRSGRLPAVRDGLRWLVDPADLAAIGGGRATRGHGRLRTDGADRLQARMVAGDEPGSWGVLEEAIAYGLSPSAALVDLLGPALRAIGDGWATGELAVADEHRAVAVAQRLIGRLGPRFARRGPKRGTVVLGAVAGDEHALPSAMVADVLRGGGFDAVDLGADTPPEAFAGTAAEATRLVAVLVGTTVPGADRALRRAVRAVRATGVEVPILLGGAGTSGDAHARALGATGWSGADAEAAERAVDALSRPDAAARPARR